MGLFGKIVKTVVNVAELPVSIAKDVVTLGGVSRSNDKGSYTIENIQKIKDEADD